MPRRKGRPCGVWLTADPRRQKQEVKKTGDEEEMGNTGAALHQSCQWPEGEDGLVSGGPAGEERCAVGMRLMLSEPALQELDC